MNDQIIIKLRGGLIQEVVSTNENISVFVCDYDLLDEGSEEEIEAVNEAEKREQNGNFKVIY
jgi:hypothetical protein